MEYWKAVLPETPMPPAIHGLLTKSEVKDNHVQRLHMDMFAKGVRKIGPNSEEERANTGDLKKYPYWYESESPNDHKKYPFWYVSGSTEDLKKYPFWYGAESTKDLKEKLLFSHGPGSTKDLKRYPFWYGPGRTEDIKKYPFWSGSESNEDVETFSVEHGPQSSDDLSQYPFWYGSGSTKDPFWYGSRSDHGLKKFRVENTKDLKRHPFWFRFGSSEEDLKKFQLQSEQDEDNMGNQDEEDLPRISGSVPRDEEKMSITDSAPIKGNRIYFYITWGEPCRHTQIGRNTPQGSIFFFRRDVLRPGSVITPTIPPTTTLPPLLRRRVADSIPFSTEHFADILAMFAPESHAIAGEMHWTLEACEHPGALLPGYRAAGCATSLESLAELPVALLRTRDVRAFSPDMSTDVAGTPARRGRYNVTTVKRITESPEIVTCHDTTYPYAVFFCHTASPTAAYAVTLAAEDGNAPAMEALAVCHLDRSRAHGDEPSEAAACHFLTKLSVIWVPAGEQVGGARDEAQ
ncbi:BURP domain-containing protein 11-like [Panicum hallii]|uniref:BURP domain-containing protein 11-like n=1 Tax=Panicum hallii TaxID=206008 RepID=UPI000DF4CCBD|nr:BURP domain-containing protein 11-like [Panicum hallii]